VANRLRERREVVAEPVALATAVNEHDLTSLAQAVGHALAATFKVLLRYL